MDAGIKQVQLTTLEVEAHGDAAHEVGAYLMGEGGKQLDSGKYVVVWKKDGGNSGSSTGTSGTRACPRRSRERPLTRGNPRDHSTRPRDRPGSRPSSVRRALGHAPRRPLVKVRRGPLLSCLRERRSDPRLRPSRRPLSRTHFCFRVSEAEFDRILRRSRPTASSTEARHMAQWTCRSTPTTAAASCTGIARRTRMGGLDGELRQAAGRERSGRPQGRRARAGGPFRPLALDSSGQCALWLNDAP